MQIKKIAVLVGLACGIAGSANAALTAAQQAVLTDANTNGRVFFLSGASATQGGLSTIEAGMFNAGSFRLANTTASSKNYEAIAGTMTSGAWAGKNAIFIYRVKGGSVWGVNAVARAESIETLVVNAANCGASGAGTAASPYVCNVSDGTASKPHRVPDAGVSDVAPVFFKDPFNTEGETPAAALSEAELAEFADTTYNKPIFTLAFAPAVTNNVNVPLNKAAIAAIMAGNVGTWNQVDSSLPADDIVVCRRVQGSGTQAVFNNYFGGFPCAASSSNVPAGRDVGGAWDGLNYTVVAGTGALNVIENSSSGDVRNCLAAAANPAGATYTTSNRDGAPVTVTFAPKAGGHKAIGVLSMDSVGSSNAAGAWSFRSLDGQGTVSCTGTCPATTAPVTAGTGKFPLAASLIDGTWDMQGWVSFNVPTRTINDAAKASVASVFLNKAQDPAVLLGVNNFKHVAAALPTSISGYSGAGVARAAYLNNDQCAPLNRN